MVFSQPQEQKNFAMKYRQVKYWMLQRSALLSRTHWADLVHKLQKSLQSTLVFIVVIKPISLG